MSDNYLDRNEAAQYLNSRGLKYSRNTLQKLATIGGGPTYRRFGNRAVYVQADLDEWIETKLTAPRRSTSEAA